MKAKVTSVAAHSAITIPAMRIVSSRRPTETAPATTLIFSPVCPLMADTAARVDF
jgi:hypothetical protein